MNTMNEEHMLDGIATVALMSMAQNESCLINTSLVPQLLALSNHGAGFGDNSPERSQHSQHSCNAREKLGPADCH